MTFRPSLIFANKTGAYPCSGAPFSGKHMALPANLRLGYKGLTMTNTLGYFAIGKFTAIKCFMTLALGLQKQHKFIHFSSLIFFDFQLKFL